MRNDSSSLVATDIQRLNAGCRGPASTVSFSVGSAKLLALIGIHGGGEVCARFGAHFTYRFSAQLRVIQHQLRVWRNCIACWAIVAYWRSVVELECERTTSMPWSFSVTSSRPASTPTYRTIPSRSIGTGTSPLFVLDSFYPISMLRIYFINPRLPQIWVTAVSFLPS